MLRRTWLKWVTASPLTGCAGDNAITRPAELGEAESTQGAPDAADGTYGDAGPTPPQPPARCVATESDAEGPFYTSGAPFKELLAPKDAAGERIVLTGTLWSLECKQALAHHVLDLWHTNAAGEYDNTGFVFRGQFRSDEFGRFRVETILPGRYDARPVRHIHTKVRAPDGSELLTTQIYIAGDGELKPAHEGPRVVLVEGELRLDLVV